MYLVKILDVHYYYRFWEKEGGSEVALGKEGKEG